MIDDATEYSGILCIGDPHTCSITPGTRMESDFATLSVNKLKFSLEYADKHNLLPVCLGDLLTKHDDNNIVFFGMLMGVLASHPNMICLVGNHDKSEHETFNESDMINIIDKADVIHLINSPGVFGEFNIDGQKVTLGASPYGHDIPDEVKSNNEVVWFTHHDVNFDPRFAHIACKNIKGCRTVVNGHLHKTFEPIRVGNTLWHNPGNILRMSRAEKEHTPSIWIWHPSDVNTLEQVIIPHNKDVFIEEKDGIVVDDTVDPFSMEESRSIFVEALKSDVSIDAHKTQDGSLVRGYIQQAFVDVQPCDDVKELVMKMLDDVVEEQQA